MKNLFTSSALICAAAAFSATGLALAQDATGDAESTVVRPRYVTLPPKPATTAVTPNVALATWNGSFTHNGTNYPFQMVGADPSTNKSTTVPVILIPIKIVITSSTGTKTTFDPGHVLSNGKTVIQNTVASPIFDKTTSYTAGGANVGTTQYIDAYQRANFWGTVQNNPNSHVLLGGPTVLNTITLSPSSRYGKTGSPFGFTAGEVNINWFDAQINSIITKITKIQPNTFPIFLTYDVYLTQGGCCIGGYHSATGSQTYAHATYVDVVGQFSQDVSALSHEVGEWTDDPLLNGGNNTPCGILENGDPLENNPNFGGFSYPVNGFSYTLQDLVTLPYFGAPSSTSAGGIFTFHGQTLSVCQNGA
ncbi:MAG: hypothetical protein U0Q18_27915 [Bryobacteraceae bacterium]